MPCFEMAFSWYSTGAPLARSSRSAANLAYQHRDRIEVAVHHPFFQRNDGVVRDVNLLGTYFRAALRDVAVADAELLAQHRNAVRRVQRMHFEAGHAHKKSRAAELLLFVMIAQHVADILAQEAFNALAEFLYPVNFPLVHLPFRARLGLKRRNLLVHTVVPGDVRDQVLDPWE